MSQGYQSLRIRKRCFRWDSDKSRAIQLSHTFLQELLLKIMRWLISLCGKNVLNDMMIFNEPTMGNT